MPTYTYRCGNCGHHFDLYQQFDDADPDTCPNCGLEHRLQRVYKPVGVVFKGSGFYATDNKSGKALSVNGSPSTNGSSKADDKSAKPAEDKPKDSGAADTGSSESGTNKGKSPSEGKAGTAPGA